MILRIGIIYSCLLIRPPKKVCVDVNCIPVKISKQEVLHRDIFLCVIKENRVKI